MVRLVGIGEFLITDDPGDVIKTYALSSCVAVTAYNHCKKVAGMIHIALPAPARTDDLKEKPAYYARTGIPLMFDLMYMRYGCSLGELEVKLYGGANSIRNNDVFNIGLKNIYEVKQQLINMKLDYSDGDIGGNLIRTLEMDVDTGIITVFTQPISF